MEVCSNKSKSCLSFDMRCKAIRTDKVEDMAEGLDYLYKDQKFWPKNELQNILQLKKLRKVEEVKI